MKDGLLVDYGQGWVPQFPWVRSTTGSVPSGITAYEYLTSKYRPKKEDVFTIWNNDHDSDDWLPTYEGWNTYNVSGAVKQGPYRWLAGSNSNNTPDRFIPIVNKKYSFYCTVTKVSDYDYQVDYELPIRYIYAAAAKAVGSIIHTNEYGRDSYAFKDVVSKITIKLTAGTFTDDSSDLSYSLDNSQLTEDVANEHPLTFSKNELITQQALWGTEKWTEKMSKTILEEFKNGKHVVKCTVPVTWAIANAVKINTQMYVQLQDSSYITREGAICVFEVKTIEKRFDKDEFVFELGLMEV